MATKKKKSSSKGKIIGGALLGGVLGVAAGLLLAQESGKELRKDIKKTSANFYKYMAPHLKKMKDVGETEYKEISEKAIKAYSKAKKLTAAETKELTKAAEKYWREMRKHL